MVVLEYSPIQPNLVIREAKLSAAVLLLLAAAGCQLRSTYDGAVTRLCVSEASSGTSDLTLVRERFQRCCNRHDLQVVDPSGRECGKLGMDALLK